MTEPAVSVRDITKTYAQGEAAMRALDGVDLDVSRGELVLLMGPSGSGKTTLLSIMGCILRPTAGTIRLLGLDVTNLHERDLPRVRLERIGFVFQGFNLFPTLTAQANVALALDLKGASRRDAARRAAELLDQVGLETKRGEYPSDLSGGQKQRVAIARAIAGDPPIVLADEPTAALDTQSGHTVMALLRRLAHERDRSVVIVTHDSRMLGHADRIVHLEDGRIVDDNAHADPEREDGLIGLAGNSVLSGALEPALHS
jgi:putative ABC transport system ATP-binding protein